MKGRLGWATSIMLLAWLSLAIVRAWQVGASPSQVAPYLYAPALLVTGGLLGWWLGHRQDPRLLGGVVALASAYVALAALLTDHPGRGALGYANANAALVVQLIAVAGLVALRDRSRWYGLVGVSMGVLALFGNASQGGTASGLLVIAAVAAALLAPRARRRWPAVAVSLALCVAAVGVLTWLARRTVWPEWAVTTLSPVRRDMWNAGWSAFRRAETFGFGPGGYAQVNPWAKDADTMSAHSLPIQVAAELGGVGLTLLTLLFLSALAWATRAHSPQAAWITIAAWTALAVHAFMDHLLEFWPIPLAAGLVIGYGLVARVDPQINPSDADAQCDVTV